MLTRGQHSLKEEREREKREREREKRRGEHSGHISLLLQCDLSPVEKREGEREREERELLPMKGGKRIRVSYQKQQRY